jgi:hypothetical protein
MDVHGGTPLAKACSVSSPTSLSWRSLNKPSCLNAARSSRVLKAVLLQTFVAFVRADICYAAARDALKRAPFSLEEALISL